MANEYISREAMHKANRYEWDGACGDYDGHQIFIDNESMIDSIPAADVRPVARGEWFEPDDDYGYLVCSVCEERSPNDERWSFCPNCGADMRRWHNG